MITANNLANNILMRSFKQNSPVTPMKLQKLIYFIFKQYYKEKNCRLFVEDFLAWPYGPVVQSVYDEFRSFGANNITKFAKDSQGNVFMASESADPDLSRIINSVWTRYLGVDGIQLSRITHLPGSAWANAKYKGSPTLDLEDIKGEPDN